MKWKLFLGLLRWKWIRGENWFENKFKQKFFFDTTNEKTHWILLNRIDWTHKHILEEINSKIKIILARGLSSISSKLSDYIFSPLKQNSFHFQHCSICQSLIIISPSINKSLFKSKNLNQNLVSSQNFFFTQSNLMIKEMLYHKRAHWWQ